MQFTKLLSLAACVALVSGCAAPPDTTPTTDTPTQPGSTVTTSSGATSTADINTEEVAYGAQDRQDIKGYIAYPTTPGPHKALVLIHEWWGLNQNMKDNAEKYAKMGYVALAVDLYNGSVATTQEEAGKLAGAVRSNTDVAMDNLSQAVAFLKNRTDVDDARIASVGWCFGGGWSYQMAKNDMGVKATVMYYGQFDPEDDFAMMKSHIIGHFGGADTSIKVDTVNEFEVALTQAGKTHEIYIYPNAGHGFANPDGAAYDAQAAALADQRTVDFLSRTLQ